MSTHLSRRRTVPLVVVASFAVVGAAQLWAASPGSGEPANLREPMPARLAPHVAAQVPDGAVQTPLGFARDAVMALNGYDTRSPRDPWRRALLSALGTPEASLGAQDVDRLIPDAAQWSQMAEVGQRASATIGSVYVPALWTQTAREHPELPDGAAGVTVTGTQLVSWSGGTSPVPVAVTVLLLCPPATERCVVSRITAQVAR